MYVNWKLQIGLNDGIQVYLQNVPTYYNCIFPIGMSGFFLLLFLHCYINLIVNIRPINRHRPICCISFSETTNLQHCCFLIGHTKDSSANLTEGNYGLTERPQALTVDHFWRGKQHKQLLLHMPSAINYRQASVHWTPTTYRLKLCIIWLGSWGLSWLSERQLRLLACT